MKLQYFNPFISQIESLDFLFLLKTIEDFYKSEDGENLEILCPVQDQACVAKFEDGVWYRAKVIGRQFCTLFLQGNVMLKN